MVEYKLSKENPMILTYQKYLQMNYSSPKTRELYESEAKKFLTKIYKKTNSEPMELTQNILDEYVIWLNSRKNTNPFYRGFIKSFRLAFDEDEKLFRLKTRTDRSKQRTEIEEYDWLTEDSINKLIEKGSEYVSMMVSIYWDTGRRLSEVIKCNLKNKDWDLDLTKRRLKGLGKGNQEFIAHFSKKTAGKIYRYMLNLGRTHPEYVDTPFIIFSNRKKPAKNQGSAFDNRLKKECKILGIKDIHGKEVHTHSLRHSVGRYLAEKGWKIEQVAVKLSHKKLDNTRKYISPDIEQIEQLEDRTIFDKEDKK